MEGVKEAVTTQLLGTLNLECNGLCHRKKERSSLFRRIPVDTMVDFKWAQMIEELESRAPLLLRIFDCLVTRTLLKMTFLTVQRLLKQMQDRS